ncbi:MAG: hypothetical protein ACRD6N_06455 [Pyrinomonadaceae bacterium]
MVARQSVPVIGVQCAGGEGSGSSDGGFLDRGRWQLSVGFRKQRSHRHFVGTEEQKQRAEQGTEVVNNIYLYDVAGRPSEAIMSVADQYLARAGLSRPIPSTRQWAFTIGWRIEGVPVRDLIGKSNGFRRPGYGMAVEPGVQYFRARDTWSVTVPIAAGRNRKRSVSDILVGSRGGDAAFADYMILLGYSHRF